MKNFFIVIIFLAGIVLVARSYSPASGDVKLLIDKVVDMDFSPTPENPYQGMASYYSDEYVGRRTSSGQVFSQYRMTAAHKTLPLGTKVRVTDLENHKQVVVTINDRGPFRPGRIIDLTKAAAQKLGMLNSGVADVRLEVISPKIN